MSTLRNPHKVNQNVQFAIERILHDRPVGYHPLVARAVGSVTAGIFLSQLLYWTPRAQDEEGWFWKTRDEIYAETALTRYEQETARRMLRDTGVLEEKRAGVPARIWYRVNLSRLTELLAGVDAGDERPPTSWGKTHQLNGGNPTDWTGAMQPTIAETTTKITFSNIRTAHALRKAAASTANLRESQPQHALPVGDLTPRAGATGNALLPASFEPPADSASAAPSVIPQVRHAPPGFTPAAAVLHEHYLPRHSPASASQRLAIGAYIREYARALGDQATEKQTISRACNLYEEGRRLQPDLDLSTFFNLLVEASRLTQANKRRIRAGGVAYFFAVLEGLLGLREPLADAPPEGAKIAPEPRNSAASGMRTGIVHSGGRPLPKSSSSGQFRRREPARGAE